MPEVNGVVRQAGKQVPKQAAKDSERQRQLTWPKVSWCLGSAVVQELEAEDWSMVKFQKSKATLFGSFYHRHIPTGETGLREFLRRTSKSPS